MSTASVDAYFSIKDVFQTFQATYRLVQKMMAISVYNLVIRVSDIDIYHANGDKIQITPFTTTNCLS